MVGCWLNPWLVYDILFFNKIALYEIFYLWTLCLFMIFFSWIKLLYMKFSLLLLVLSYLPKDWRLLLSKLITIWAHNLLFLLWLRSLWRFGVFGSPSIGFGFPSLCLLGRSSLWGHIMGTIQSWDLQMWCGWRWITWRSHFGAILGLFRDLWSSTWGPHRPDPSVRVLIENWAQTGPNYAIIIISQDCLNFFQLQGVYCNFQNPILQKITASMISRLGLGWWAKPSPNRWRPIGVCYNQLGSTFPYDGPHGPHNPINIRRSGRHMNQPIPLISLWLFFFFFDSL